MRKFSRVAWAALAASTIASAGCADGDGLPREPVSGTVKLDGRPLNEGSITFVPTGGDGPPVGGLIQDGVYSLVRDEGPIPGPHRVSIYSQQPTGKKIPDQAEPGVMIDERRETLPKRYNVDSQLAADVQAGGHNEFDFELTGSGASKSKP